MAAFRIAKAVEKGEVPPPADNGADNAAVNATTPASFPSPAPTREDAEDDVPLPPGSNATGAP
jgi:penicillin-binding protein 2